MKKKPEGFTLIELLLYLSLSVIMVVLLGGIGVNVLSSLTNAKAQEELQYNAQFVTEKIHSLVSEAEAIEAPLRNATSSTLQLTRSDLSKNPTIIEVVAGRLQVREGAGESQVLSGSNVVVTATEFSNLTYEGGKGSVRLAFQLGLYNPDNRTALKTNATFYTTINLKYP